MLSDFHIHSYFSADSDLSFEDLIASARNKNLYSVCITDHMDEGLIDVQVPPRTFTFDVINRQQAVELLKERYKSVFPVYNGIEFGFRNKLKKESFEVLNKPFDFVLLSIHAVADENVINKEYYLKRGTKKALSDYFEETVDGVKKTDNFDSLAHFDYVIRCIPEIVSGEKALSEVYDCKEFSGSIDEVLKTLVKKDKALEINTAGLRKQCAAFHPAKEIVKRFLSLGGKYFTVGSDAHRAEDIAYGYETAKRFLLSIGVKEYAIYENRTPKLIPIV